MPPEAQIEPGGLAAIIRELLEEKAWVIEGVDDRPDARAAIVQDEHLEVRKRLRLDAR